MQVSWIDPEEIRDLLAQIEGPLPRPAANNFAWELNTLPVVPLPPLPADNMVDGPALKQTPEAQPPPPPPPSEFPLSEQRSGPASGDLWRIRERLRSLREQAQESGILPRGEDTVAFEPPPTAEPIYSPPPPPEPSVAMPVNVVNELMAEFAATMQEPAPPPLPPGYDEEGPLEEEPLPNEHEPAAILPTPAVMFDPMDLPAPTPPPASVGPVTIEFAGPAPGRPEYEPLFSHGAQAVAAPFATVEPPLAPPQAVTSPFSLAEPEPVAQSDKPPFVVPALGLSDRLAALAQWATQRLGTAEVLLVDDYGDVLWGGHAQTPLVLSAMMAWHAAQRSTAETACHDPQRIDKDLANGRALTVLPARTRYGIISLAAIQETPMDAADEQAIRTALVLAVEGSE